MGILLSFGLSSLSTGLRPQRRPASPATGAAGARQACADETPAAGEAGRGEHRSKGGRGNPSILQLQGRREHASPLQAAVVGGSNATA